LGGAATDALDDSRRMGDALQATAVERQARVCLPARPKGLRAGASHLGLRRPVYPDRGEVAPAPGQGLRRCLARPPGERLGDGLPRTRRRSRRRLARPRPGTPRCPDRLRQSPLPADHGRRRRDLDLLLMPGICGSRSTSGRWFRTPR
jgi:hypothetical protein